MPESSARQLWEAAARRFGQGDESIEVTLLFTDLHDFSRWSLKVGDGQALERLRAVATVVEPCIPAHGGKLVKRLGHGLMAVFNGAGEALGAALDMQAATAALPAEDPRLRIGLHAGRPRRLGGDYLGADVNIAARITDAAAAGEVLVSGEVLEDMAPTALKRLKIKRRRAFRARGAPPGLKVFCVTARAHG